MSNLRQALRQATRYPGFSITIVLMLALGIGATTAMFSLYYSVLLRPLPVPEPERLVNLMSPGPRIGGWSTGIAGGVDSVFSYPMFRDLEEGQEVFTGIAAHRTFDANVSGAAQAESSQGLVVSGQYFEVLGLVPALGRLIGPQDEAKIGESKVVVLSFSYWQNRFGGNPKILGQTLTVNGQSLTVIGVAPQGFSGTSIGVEPTIYVPLTLAWLVQPGMGNDENERRWYWLHLFARLRDGVSIEQATASIGALHSSILSDVEAPMFGLSGDLLEQFRSRPMQLEPGARGQSSRRANMRQPLVLLFGLTAVVLGIVCANIASLLLARGTSREGEVAVRVSLGATRWRLFRQFLSEMTIFAVIGGVASFPVTSFLLRGIVALLPPERSGVTQSSVDATAALFAAAAAFTAMLLFGTLPALRRSRIDGRLAIHGATAAVSPGKAGMGFLRSSASAQVALAIVLLVLAGLFTQSLRNVSRVDLGMDIDSVSTFSVSPSLNGYGSEQVNELYRNLAEEISAQPSVLDVSSALVPLLSFTNFSRPVSVDGVESGPAVDSNVSFNVVSPGFFRTLSIPLLAGRNFMAADQDGVATVAVVNESFVRKFDLDEPLGRHFSFPNAPDADFEIVGIVADAKYNQVKDEIPPQFYLPLGRSSGFGALTFYVRSELPPETMLGPIRSTVAEVDPNLPVEDLQAVRTTLRENVFLDRTIAVLSLAFSAFATLLTAIGLYGLLAYNMNRRTRELGLRLALGSTRERLGRLVLRQVAVLAVTGSLLGIAVAIGLGRLVQSMLFGLSGFNLTSMLAAVTVLGLVILASSYLPARRAMRLDPMQALREE